MTVIYFIQTKSGPIKIGYVKLTGMKYIIKRLGCLQVGSPEPLKIIAVMLGGISQERQLHIRFAESRIRYSGEWFNPDQSLLEFIKTNAFEHPNKSTDLDDLRPILGPVDIIQRTPGRRNKRLTKEQVLKIRADFKKYQTTYIQLADKYGCLPSTIGDIVKRRTHRDLP